MNFKLSKEISQHPWWCHNESSIIAILHLNTFIWHSYLEWDRQSLNCSEVILQLVTLKICVHSEGLVLSRMGKKDVRKPIFALWCSQEREINISNFYPIVEDLFFLFIKRLTKSNYSTRNWSLKKIMNHDAWCDVSFKFELIIKAILIHS